MNHDKWVGVGGKFLDKESPEECLLREVKEETGLTLTDYRFRGIVTFVSDQWPTEYMYLYTATGFEGEMIVCDEGDLEWVEHDSDHRPAHLGGGQAVPAAAGGGSALLFLEAGVPRGYAGVCGVGRERNKIAEK